jgi:hypothetical protein
MLTEQEPKSYISYEQLPYTWEAIQKIGYEKAVEIITSWEEVKKQNAEIHTYNNALYKEAIEKTLQFFKASGVKFHKTSVYGKITGQTKEGKVFYEALIRMYKVYSPSYPSPSSITYKGQRISTCSGCHPLEILKSAKFNYEQQMKREEQTCVNLKEALKVAKETDIDITECTNAQDIYHTVNEMMRDRWAEDNFLLAPQFTLNMLVMNALNGL